MKTPIDLIRERANIVRAMPQKFMQTIADDLEKLIRAHEVMRQSLESECIDEGPTCECCRALEAADKIMCEDLHVSSKSTRSSEDPTVQHHSSKEAARIYLNDDKKSFVFCADGDVLIEVSKNEFKANGETITTTHELYELMLKFFKVANELP